MSLYKQPKSTQWSIRISHNGEVIRRTTGTDDRREAQRIHDQVKAELWATSPKLKGKTWGMAVMNWCGLTDRSDSELMSLAKFSRVFPDRLLKDVTRDSVNKALAFCETAGTHNRYIGMITAIMNAAIAEEWLTKVPKLARKVEKNKKIRSWLTHDQWDRLYAELPVHMRPMAQFAVESGLRQANVLQLRWSQLDLDRQLVWIEASEMKGGKAIAIPLSQGALEVLRGQVGQHVDFVFTFRSKPIKEIKTAFIAACVRAEVGQFDEAGKYSGFTWHGLRHTWATWHIQNGTPLEVLQKLGGWSDLRMVMNYAHHSPGHLASYANNTRATHDALHRKDDRPRPSNLTGHPDFQVSRQGHDLHGDA